MICENIISFYECRNHGLRSFQILTVLLVNERNILIKKFFTRVDLKLNSRSPDLCQVTLLSFFPMPGKSFQIESLETKQLL